MFRVAADDGFGNSVRVMLLEELGVIPFAGPFISRRPRLRLLIRMTSCKWARIARRVTQS